MGRLASVTGEIRDHPTTDVGSPDGYSGGAALTVTDLTVFHGGKASIKCPGTAANSSYRVRPFPAPAADTTLYRTGYRRFDALPSSATPVAWFAAGATDILSARLTSAGKLQLWNDIASTQIGSDSTDTIAINQWYRIELKLKIGTGATDDAELRLATDPDAGTSVSVASTTGASITDTQPTQFGEGWRSAPGNTANTWLDDVALNDSTDTSENTWAQIGAKGYLLPAASAHPPQGVWESCDGDDVAENGDHWDYVNNTPPLGVADHSTAGHGPGGGTDHLIRMPDGVDGLGHLYIGAQSYGKAGILGNLVIVGSGFTMQPVGSASGNQKVAQDFYPTGTLIAYAEMTLKKIGSPSDNLIVEWQTDSGGQPSGTVLSSETLAGSLLTTSIATYRLAAPTGLTANARHWAVVRRSGSVDASNYFEWVPSQEIYAYKEIIGKEYNGSVWSTITVEDKVLSLHLFQDADIPTFSVVHPLCCHGEDVATGTKQGRLGVKKEPLVTLSSFNFGDDVGACGTYPSNWRWKVLTNYGAPSHIGAEPILDVHRQDSTARVADICFLGLLAEAVPALPVVETSGIYDDGGVVIEADVRYDSRTGYILKLETRNSDDKNWRITVETLTAADWVITSTAGLTQTHVPRSALTKIDADAAVHFTPV